MKKLNKADKYGILCVSFLVAFVAYVLFFTHRPLLTTGEVIIEFIFSLVGCVCVGLYRASVWEEKVNANERYLAMVTRSKP